MDKEHVMEHIKLISGSANKPLAEEIAKCLGVSLTPIVVKKFADGETYVRINESVRGCNVFVIQSTSNPANENLMELLILADALKRASANDVIGVVPYFGYARQEKKVVPREPITAKLVANLLTTAGIKRMITFDLHVIQIQGFFDIPVDNLEAMPLFVDYLIDRNIKDIVVVSPDAGGAARAREFSKLLNTGMAMIDKRRPSQNEAQVMNIIGDVEGKNVVMVDDMVDTAGTIALGAEELKRRGARDIYVCATHAVLSGPSIERLEKSPIKEIIVSNSIDLGEKKVGKIKVISLAPILAETIKRVHFGEPMGLLFDKLFKQLSTKR
ncbi:ribose-phosphate pyrophosphokinase [Candidatus Woesearchaeota archaeon]|nr:ribose-phosphate pyrophosphokinase [Candidatus Woesearchaeota archaeon]